MDSFVGRGDELAVLERCLADALRGVPRFVVCAGEPGIGKSYLVEVLAANAREGGVSVRWLRSSPDAEAASGLWHSLLAFVDDAPDRSTGSPPINAATDRAELLNRITGSVIAHAAPAGLLVVLDDIQWADPSSLAVVAHLARHLRDVPLLVVATARTAEAGDDLAWRDVAPRLLQEPAVERLDLHGLSPSDTATVFANSGGPIVDGDAARELHRRTAGNPFFVRELGRARATLPDVALPPTVLDVVTSRVDALAPDVRSLLDAAAVAGDRFTVPVVAAMLDRSALACLAEVDLAVAGGFLDPRDVAGEFQFAHGLVREALEARMSLTQRVALHERAALAIESAYSDRLDEFAADLARHGVAIAVTGERRRAIEWSRRAAEQASAARAHADAARLYRQAVDVGGPQLDDADRASLLLAAAEAWWRAGEFDEARDDVDRVTTAADRAGRPDLAARGVLALEPVGDRTLDRDLRERCIDVLDALGEGHDALRARLLARAAEASIYAEDADAEEATAMALSLASSSADPIAIVSALRARQLALTAPQHTDERRDLADRMIETGQLLRDPVTEMWGRLWRIDTHWERGDIVAVRSELGRLQWCVEHVGGPVARWHLLLVQGALAQATGAFDDALGIGREAFGFIVAISPSTGFGSFHSLLGTIRHHTGAARIAPIVAELFPGPPRPESEPSRETVYLYLGPAMMLAGEGRLDEAAELYARLGPVERWAPQPYFLVSALVVGSIVATALGATDDLVYFRERLLEHRGRHVVVPAGNASYFGPVELALGRIAGALGRDDEAEEFLTHAASTARSMGTPAFLAEANVLLAELLARRGTTDSVQAARAMAAEASSLATRLGMPPWEQRASLVLESLRVNDRREGPLSQRETEVAQLVAKGLTNREIAETLFVSERTAQNHVQHILTKLGFSNRSQIATWVTASVRDE